MSASEKTFRRLIEDGGRHVVGGELVRLVDIKLGKAKIKGIYQELHGFPTLRAFCAELRKAIARHHGTAGRAYLRWLVRALEDDKEGLVVWLAERVASYLRRACLAGQEPEAESVAARFALVYAAGCLAAKHKLLPWSDQEIFTAVRYCHRRAHAEAEPATPASKPSVSHARLVRAVAKRIARHRPDFIDRRQKAAAATVKAALGFVHAGKNGTELLFLPTTFRKIVCADLDEQAVIAALKAKGLLVVHNGGKSSVPRTLPEPLGRTRVIGLKAGIERFAPDGEAQPKRRKRRLGGNRLTTGLVRPRSKASPTNRSRPSKATR